MRMLLHWLLSAVTLLLVAHFVPGFHVAGLLAALIAVVVIGLVNATLGLILKLLTFPLTILSFGLFLLVINAAMLMLASRFVAGFRVDGFVPAFIGAALIFVLNMIWHWMLKPVRRNE
jgi:putative membrane protein